MGGPSTGTRGPAHRGDRPPVPADRLGVRPWESGAPSSATSVRRRPFELPRPERRSRSPQAAPPDSCAPPPPEVQTEPVPVDGAGWCRPGSRSRARHGGRCGIAAPPREDRDRLPRRPPQRGRPSLCPVRRSGGGGNRLTPGSACGEVLVRRRLPVSPGGVRLYTKTCSVRRRAARKAASDSVWTSPSAIRAGTSSSCARVTAEHSLRPVLGQARCVPGRPRTQRLCGP